MEMVAVVCRMYMAHTGKYTIQIKVKHAAMDAAMKSMMAVADGCPVGWRFSRLNSLYRLSLSLSLERSIRGSLLPIR